MAEKEFVEGTRVDVDGNETPMYMDRDMGAEEGFKVIAVRTCCQEHRWRRGPFWLNSFRLVNGISGIVIGSMVWLYIPFANTADKVLILCAIVGLVAGATPSYSVDTRSFLAFVLPSCLLPISYYAWNTPDGYGPIIGMFVLYIIVMIRVAFQSRESLIKNFELTYTLNYRATHDALSGLLNRQELENQFLIATPKSQHGIAMLFLDLDNFKSLNDSLGHHSGDEAPTGKSEISTPSSLASNAQR